MIIMIIVLHYIASVAKIFTFQPMLCDQTHEYNAKEHKDRIGSESILHLLTHYNAMQGLTSYIIVAVTHHHGTDHCQLIIEMTGLFNVARLKRDL